MKKILVTGSKGQLGNELQKIAPEFQGFDFLFTDIEELDILDPIALEKFVSSFKPDFIINCAAYTAVDKAESEKEKAEMLNAFAVRNLRNISEKDSIFLIHISTDYVYDGKNHRPYVEDDAVSPLSAYGRSKLNGERELSSYPNVIIIRTSWLYSSFGSNFVKTILRLGKEKPEIKVVFDQVGTPTYASDLAKAIMSILGNSINNKTNLQSGIYHYSNEGVCSWYDFTLEIIQLSGLKCKIKPIVSGEYPTIAVRPFYSVLDKSKIKSTFGIEIPHWKESLQKCLKQLNNEN